MDIGSLQSFLSSAKSSVNTALTSTVGESHVVLGNEAADLDSVVSSMITGYYIAHSLAKEDKENKTDGFVFPVVNCLRDDLPLRTEVLYFLKANGIRLESLICRDEIDLTTLHNGGRLKLTLVDHNMLGGADSHLSSSVIKVIDHHKRDRPFDRRDTIESVGSCATLVAEIVLGLFDKDLLVMNLLYGTILLDTVNLAPEASRATPKDMSIIAELEECIFSASGSRPIRSDIYSPIVLARSDISQLTAEQLLRKDLKILKTPEISIAVPAVPLLSQKYLELPGALEALKGCLRNNRCSGIVLMGFEVVVGAETGIRRDLTVFSDSIHKAKQLSMPLEGCSELQLNLIRSSTDSQSCYWIYDQKNAGLSRKFILPFLAGHFEVKAQNQLDVDAVLAGVEILIPNGEMSPNKHAQLPSISYTSVQNLAVGDPISHGGSNQSSAYNSCPYTPQNSCAEPEDGYPSEHYFLPSFNSREMIEKIESKRHKLRGYERTDELNPTSYPFTPKNSYVDSSMDAAFGDRYAQFAQNQNQNHPPHVNVNVLHAIDSEVLLRKLMEKRNAPNSNSNASSKSQSLTELTPAGDTAPQLSPQRGFNESPPSDEK